MQGSALFETYVAQNLAGIIDAEMPGGQLSFWNVQGRHEVDFVVEAGNKCLAVEVKYGLTRALSDLSGLKVFLERTPHCVGAILAYNGTKSIRAGDKLWVVPVGTLLS
jgi:predicted AAA+ superfamily ATPase